jgi:hypothetical protein
MKVNVIFILYFNFLKIILNLTYIATTNINSIRFTEIMK